MSDHSFRLTRFFYSPEERPDQDTCAQLHRASEWIDVHVTAPLLLYQEDALRCLVSDVLHGLAEAPVVLTLDQSFLMSALNRGMYQIAGSEFFEFCYVGGQFNPRAWQKRRAEHYLFSLNTMLF